MYEEGALMREIDSGQAVTPYGVLLVSVASCMTHQHRNTAACIIHTAATHYTHLLPSSLPSSLLPNTLFLSLWYILVCTDAVARPGRETEINLRIRWDEEFGRDGG